MHNGEMHNFSHCYKEEQQTLYRIAPRRILITVWKKGTTKASCFMVNHLGWRLYSEVYAVFQAKKIKLLIKKLKYACLKTLHFLKIKILNFTYFLA